MAFAFMLSHPGYRINSLWYPFAALHCWFGARSAALYSLVRILLNPVTSAWPDICSTPQDCPLAHTHINTDNEYQPPRFLILVLLHNQRLNEWSPKGFALNILASFNATELIIGSSDSGLLSAEYFCFIEKTTNNFSEHNFESNRQFQI